MQLIIDYFTANFSGRVFLFLSSYFHKIINLCVISNGLLEILQFQIKGLYKCPKLNILEKDTYIDFLFKNFLNLFYIPTKDCSIIPPP